MIEMRWMDDGAGLNLQYRHLLMKVKTKWYEDDVGGVMVPADERGYESPSEHWSEWKAIPLVRDDAARGEDRKEK